MLSERRREYLLSLIEAHLKLLVKRNRVSERYIPEYRRELWRMTLALDAAGLQTSPMKIGEEEIMFIIKEFAGHCKGKTQKWYVTILNGYLKTHGNHVVS
ncbi:MAG: hypothetical protein QHG94_08130 [Candidatus Methanosuratincola sp.]|jgi:hypothetical protein|nr:hypothetical protein [Candidatus Methanosuratincola sp.]